MRKTLRGILVVVAVTLLAAVGAYAQAKPATVTCVGLYSETDAGTISYRVGQGAWVIIKVGDKIPANAEIRVNVDGTGWSSRRPATPTRCTRSPAASPGEVLKKVADLLKEKPKLVVFPKGTKDKPDPKFKDKLVVTEYLGRQIYMTSDGSTRDIKYGDVLDITGKVTIIAINNTITLMNSSGAVTTVIGPLKFEVEKVLKNEKLYKFLNVPR